MTVMFGGDECPLGLSVQFLRAGEAEVIAALNDALGPIESTLTNSPFPVSLRCLAPFQAPWTRILTGAVGRWTAVANNGLRGGDGTAPGPAIARKLDVSCVVATHAPPFGPGHATTQLEVFGPGGRPPLMYARSLSASATDGRWEWHESGSPLDFEEVDRYSARVKRTRFDRPMLLRYLNALGISTQDESYGTATLHQRLVGWPSLEVSLEEERKTFRR